MNVLKFSKQRTMIGRRTNKLKVCHALSIGIILLLLLSGCWDEKEIGEVNFATAIGIDFVDGNYVLYVQMMDFSNVAKQEGAKQSADAPLFVGQSSGKTFNEAMNNLYKTAQAPINWGQVGSIIYSESVLEQGIEKVDQAIRRNGEFRYTPWVYGTKESIKKIFSVTGFFHLPPIYTILFQPEQIYNVYSYIEPLRMHRFISIYNEPAGTAFLPSISIDTNAWQELAAKEDPKETLRINGSFPIDQGKLTEWMSYEELIGLRWMDAKVKNTPVDIIVDGEHIGVVQITSPKATIKQVNDGEEATFQFQLKMRGHVADLEEKMSSEQIEKIISQQVKDDIMQTFQASVDKDIDVYNLKHWLFRNGMTLEEVNNYQLSMDSLNEISVTVHVESKGVYD